MSSRIETAPNRAAVNGFSHRAVGGIADPHQHAAAAVMSTAALRLPRSNSSAADTAAAGATMTYELGWVRGLNSIK